ncbi:MAG TPA: glycosyltransferase family 4 protein [Candidatus Krumholzibacteria bacterium]|nr:glycosyltransferase family 4 protein [Candidatus Krumholzibacteria bacterium]
MSPADGTGRQRVLVLTGIFPNRSSPTWGVHVFQNVRALSAHADVRVVATVPAFRTGAGVPERDTWDGIDVNYPRFLVIPKVARFLHGWEYFYSIRAAVSRVVKEFRPDVILAYFAYPYGFAAVRFGKMFGLPVVISCRGSDIYHMAKPRLQGRMIVSSLRACRRVFVMSTEMRDQVLSWGLDAPRVEVVSNGVDAERFRPMDRAQARAALGIPNDARVIVCVSRLSHEKGIDVLVEAMKKMNDATRLYVIGDGAERAALAARIQSAGMDERVSLALTRPHDEIPRWLAAADVAVLPSRSEGMPNAVLESLACGRPVVATAVGGTRELITNPALGTLVPPGDAGGLARALSAALNDTWNEKVIAASVAERTWDAVGRRTARLLDFNRVPDSPVAHFTTAGTR